MNHDMDYAVEKYKLIFRSTYAPILYSYVRFVIDDARNKGIKKLFFLSRDSYLMYHVAERLVDTNNIDDIQIKYLKVSRYSLRTAQYHMMGKACLDYICVGGIDVTFHKILLRAGLNEKQQEDVINEINTINPNDIYRTLSKIEITKIKEELSDNNTFLNYVYDNSKMAYENTYNYLTQEGIDGKDVVVLVDSGWLGSIQESIGTITGCTENISGYYFGLYETPRNSISRYYSYYFGPKETRVIQHSNHSDIRRKVHFSNCLFEAIYSAPEGMCIGYECVNGKCNAICGHDNPNKAFINASLEVLEEYVKDISNEYSVDISQVEEIITNAMAYPSKEDVITLSNLLFCDDVVEDEYISIVREFDIEDVKNTNAIRRIYKKLTDNNYVERVSGWQEASIVKCGYRINRYLRQERLYKRIMYIRKAMAR